MQVRANTFADVYNKLITILPRYSTNIACRGLNICYELVNVELLSENNNKCYFYSNFSSRVVPIRFILAEFLWIMSASNELAAIARFNSRMTQYSDDKVVLNGAYGYRLQGQLESIIDRLLEDKHSRQAYCNIHHPTDATKKSKDIPCNTAIQFLIRDDMLHMRVISRSSDFVTGLSIDMCHWQMLHQLILNTLRKKYTMLLCGHFCYHIGSLHVYDVDRGLMSHWKETLQPEDYTYSFYMRDDFYSLKKKAQEQFLDVETLTDVANLYNFSLHEIEQLLIMNKDFNRQKERPVR